MKKEQRLTVAALFVCIFGRLYLGLTKLRFALSSVFHRTFNGIDRKCK